MDTMDLQNKTQAKPGTVEAYWYQNEEPNTGRTMYHRVIIPLAAVGDGGDGDGGEVQSTAMKIVFDWYELGLGDIYDLDGVDMAHENYEEAETFLYIDTAHHWCDVKHLKIEKTGKDQFKASGELIIEFADEHTQSQEPFSFQTTLSVLRG